jgi:hypothetical protein
MSTSPRHAWIPAALLLGVVYLVVGRVFARPTDHVQAWRLAAWLVCGAAYAAHIGYEHFRLATSPRSTAMHVAAGVALGAFGLAVAAMVHSMSASSGSRSAWLIALAAWPAITAIPAFVGALVVATVLSRRARSPGAD